MRRKKKKSIRLGGERGGGGGVCYILFSFLFFVPFCPLISKDTANKTSLNDISNKEPEANAKNEDDDREDDEDMFGV